MEDDPDYVPIEGNEQIRPAGSEAMFKEVDPNMFVGNGLAHTAGPGRGRGRAKKPPARQLKPFFDEKKHLGFDKSTSFPQALFLVKMTTSGFD